MATIEHRISKTTGQITSYRVIWYEEHQRQTESFKRYEDAQLWKNILDLHKGDSEASLRALERAQSEKKTIAEAQEHLLARFQGEAHTPETYRGYMRNHIGPVIGHFPADTVTGDDVRSVVAAMQEKGRSSKMIHNVMGHLNSILEHCVREGWATQNPYQPSMLPPKGARNEWDKFITMQEFHTIQSYVPAFYQPNFQHMLETGLRISEHVVLQPLDFGLETAEPGLHVSRALKRDDKNGAYVGPTKNRENREIGLAPHTVEMLLPLVQSTDVDDFVFQSTRGGRAQVRTLEGVWHRAVKAARRDRRLHKSPTVHSLRHTYASMMLAQGMSIWELSLVLGHASVKITEDTYAHKMPGANAKVAGYATKAFGVTPHHARKAA